VDGRSQVDNLPASFGYLSISSLAF